MDILLLIAGILCLITGLAGCFLGPFLGAFPGELMGGNDAIDSTSPFSIAFTLAGLAQLSEAFLKFNKDRRAVLTHVPEVSGAPLFGCIVRYPQSYT